MLILSPRLMKLKPSIVLALAALVLCSAGGCNLFRKSKKPKDNPAIAADVEAQFRQRWIDKRVAELTGQGKDATAARRQAEDEFREHYSYLKDEKK